LYNGGKTSIGEKRDTMDHSVMKNKSIKLITFRWKTYFIYFSCRSSSHMLMLKVL